MRSSLVHDMMLGENHRGPSEAPAGVNAWATRMDGGGSVMSKVQNQKIQQRMRRYVSRHTIERRLEQYTTGYKQLARLSSLRARVPRYAAMSK